MAVVALTGLLASAVAAEAKRSSFETHWYTVDECDPRAQFGEKLEVLLGSDPEGILSASLSVTAVVRRTVPDQWQVELSFTEQGETRSRQFTAPSCSELADAVALLVALAVDPNLENRRMHATPIVASSASSPAVPLTNAASDATPKVRDRTIPMASHVDSIAIPHARDATMPQATTHTWARFYPFLGLGSAINFGVLPGVGFGGLVIGGLQSHHLRLALVARLLGSKPAILSGPTAAHADLYSGAVALTPCWLVRFGSRISLGPCAAAELGMLWGRGEGLEGTRSVEKPWGSVRLGAHGELELSRAVRLVLAGDVGAPFGQPRFLLAGEQVHRPNSTVGGLQFLGEMHFQ